MNQALELFLFADDTYEYSIYVIPAAGADGDSGVFTGTISFQPVVEQVA